MSTACNIDGQYDLPSDQANSFYAAVARTLTRSLALYFSRPIRLFRPAKVSGLASLRSLAIKDGSSLSPQYLSSLVKQQGISVIPRHFIPPIMINAALGTVLWASYAETSIFLETHLPAHPISVAAISGGVAGGVQAFAAAPAENLRLVVEGSSSHSGWSDAWKDVFLGTQPQQSTEGLKRREARRVRAWMREVSAMAGRGWDGWGWGLAKDICGFAIFFTIFEATRHTGVTVKKVSGEVIDAIPLPTEQSPVKQQFPRIAHSVWLVSGGVIAGLAYEIIGRPWDTARKVVHRHRILVRDGTAASTSRALVNHLRSEGLISFFRVGPLTLDADVLHSGRRPRLHAALRTLARVGPWGVGFLVWEAFGPGLNA